MTSQMSKAAINTTPALSSDSGAPPASSRPAVAVENTTNASRAARPTAPSGAANANTSSGTVSSASHGRAPWIAQPSPSAHPGGTSSRAIQVNRSALSGTRLMSRIVPRSDNGATSAQARPPSRSAIAAGMPAAGSAMHTACAASSTSVSRSKYTQGGTVTCPRHAVEGITGEQYRRIGVDARAQAGVAAELGGRGEALDVADL